LTEIKEKNSKIETLEAEVAMKEQKFTEKEELLLK